jgi:Holliday junction DNA helicase RuvA
MIGHINGQVMFSDGNEVILLTASGVGHQVYFHQVLAESTTASLFISHIIKETSEELYGFSDLREKKLFEMLITVKGVGPKSAYNLISCLGSEQIIQGVQLENKKLLTKAPGVGGKAAAQIVLDLSGKINKVKMYSDRKVSIANLITPNENQTEIIYDESEPISNSHQLVMEDTLMACKELGFKEDQILTIAQKILNENKITRSEQLIHLILKQV